MPCFPSTSNSRRGAISKNALLGAFSFVILLAGVIIYVRSGPETVPTAEANKTMIHVKCAKCNAEWDMPVNEYDAKAHSVSGDGSGFLCEKCGQDGVWKSGGINMAGLPPVPGQMQEEAWKNDGQANEEASDEPPPEKPAPKASVVKRPG